MGIFRDNPEFMNNSDNHDKMFEENFLNLLKENMAIGQQLAHIGSWTHDIKKDEIFLSDEVYNILGSSPRYFDGRLEDYYTFVHPDDMDLVKSAIEGTYTGKEYDIEYRIVTPDGRTKHVTEKTRVICDKNNNPVKMVGIMQDITGHKIIQNNLKEIGENLNMAQTVAGTGSWKYDKVNDKVYWSEEVYRIFGIDPSEFTDIYSLLLLVHSEDRAAVEKVAARCLEGEYCRLELRILQSDGSVKYVMMKAEPMFDKELQIIGAIGIIQDITENKLLKDRLAKSYNNLAQAQSLAHIGSWEMDIKQSRNFMSDETYRIYGITPEQFDGTFKGFLKLVHPDDKQKITGVLENPPENNIFNMEFRIVRPDGSVRNVYQTMEITYDNEGKPAFLRGTIQDITETIALQQKIRHMYTHDDLTGLPNRAFFSSELDGLCRQAYDGVMFALAIVDIAGFKYINDELGTQMGDKLIKRISERMSESLGNNAFISRYSGDQFAVILKNQNSIENCESIIKHIISLFSEPFIIDQYELDVNVSIGVCIFPDGAGDKDSLIKFAESALVRIKQEGKNRYRFYSSGMDIQNYKQFSLRNDLRKAIKRNEFEVYYQPLVNLKSNQLLAAEALIRWKHPEWGLVLPSEFIFIAEEMGYIIALGKLVLNEICRVYKQWISKGLPEIKLSVNYSSVQFFESDFVDNIINTLNEYQLDPHFLIIEITENVLLNNSDKVISDIGRLRNYGIQLALDDFGIGFSSLSYLNTFNFDIIKIDRSFVKSIVSDETSRIITGSIASMVQKLGIKLVAEGIENWEQLSFLRKINCYCGQGYLYSRPVPSDEFEKILARGKCKPALINSARLEPAEERRRYFRIKFNNLLEADMTIARIGGKAANVGNTKVLVKNIGPGGLCFISDIKLPVIRNMILQFTAQLLDKNIRVFGCPVWTQEIEDHIYEYGIEFASDESERMSLIRVLNQVQVKMRNNLLFDEGSFIDCSFRKYFKLQDEAQPE